MNWKFWKVGALFALIATVAYAAGFERIPKDTVIQGTGTSDSKTYEWDVGLGANNPKIRANSTSPFLEFAGDGVSFLPFGSGGGGASGINVLTNGDFELGTANNWTASGSSVLSDEEGADLLNGTKSASWDASAAAETLTSDAATLPAVVDGKVCLAAFFYKGGDANLVAEVVDGSANVLAQHPLIAATEATPIVMPFLCPTADTVAWRLRATADAAEVFVDDVFTGTRDYVKPQMELISVDDPNATLSGGGVTLDDGRVLKTYDGAGTNSTDYGQKLTVSLDTILGGNPVNATTYHLCIDRNTLTASTTLTDTGEKVVAVTEANLELLTDAPEDILTTRYACLAYIRSATTGTVWSGDGARFGDLPKQQFSGPPIAVNPITYSTTRSVGTVGSVANEQGPLPSVPANTGYYDLTSLNNTLGSGGTLTNEGTAQFNAKGFFGRETVAYFDRSATTDLSSTDAFWTPLGSSDFSFGVWIKPEAKLDAAQIIAAMSSATGDRGWQLSINSDNAFGILLTNTAGAWDFTLDSPVEPEYGAWNYVAFTYDFSAQLVSLYLNGSLVDTLGSVTNVRALTTPTIRIADSTTNAGTETFLGSMQDLVFYKDTALTEAEVNANYSRRFSNHQQVAGGHVLDADSFPFTDLTDKVYFWNLNGDSLDDSGNGANLVAGSFGGPTFDALDIYGQSGVANFNDTTSLINTSEAALNPGDSDFTVGGWFGATEWGSNEHFLIANNGGASDRGWDITSTINKSILIRFASTPTTSINQLEYPVTLSPGKHHFAFSFNSATDEIRLYVDGLFAASATAENPPPVVSSSKFLIGSFDDTLAGFKLNGNAQDVFFSTSVLSDGDIAKLASSRLDHNQTTPVDDQEWLGLYDREDGLIDNQLDSGWVLDKTETSLYLDLGLNGGDTVDLNLKDVGFAPSILSVKKFNVTYTSDPCAGVECTLPHGLPGRPANVEVWHEVNVGEWERQDPSTCQATTTNLVCYFAGITTIDATHKLNVVASMSDLASAFDGDPVTSGTQTFSGDKTFTGSTVFEQAPLSTLDGDGARYSWNRGNTGVQAEIGYDATNIDMYIGTTTLHAFQIRVNNVPLLMAATSDRIGIGALADVNSPVAKLHISDGDSGASAGSNGNELFVEEGTNAGITIGTPNTGIGTLAFSDPEDADVGRITYDHATNTLSIISDANTAAEFTNTGQTNLKHIGAVGSASTCWNSAASGLRNIGTCSSARRYKTNIVDMSPEVSEKVYDLRPVEFDWIEDKGGQHDYGLIAEEVAEVLPILVQYEDEEKTVVSGVNYRHLTALLISEMKKLRERVAELEAKQ